MGAINHYWLIPLSLAQPDIPLSFDINHDFFIIDPLLAAQREESTVDIDSSPSSSLRPTFGPLSATLYHYQTLPMWNLWGARWSSFLHDSIWMHETQGGLNSAEAAPLHRYFAHRSYCMSFEIIRLIQSFGWQDG